jgi:site-specific recombinase XerD
VQPADPKVLLFLIIRRRLFMQRWDVLMDGHLRVCEARGLSPESIKTRRSELMRVGAWFRGQRPRVNLEKVDSDMLIRFLRSRSIGHAKSTVASLVTICRCMGEYLVEQNVWVKNPMRWIKGPKISSTSHLPRTVGPEQMKKIWDIAATEKKLESRHRNLAILALLYGTGIRRGELSRLKLSDWEKESGVLRIDGRKSNRDRKVCVGSGIWRCIEAYLPYRHNLLELHGRQNEDAFFINKHGEALKAGDMSANLKRLCKKAGVEASMHKFRHSCASDLIEKGVALPDVQKILGHSSLGNTMRYTHIVDPEKAKAIAKHPINKFLEVAAQSLKEAI